VAERVSIDDLAFAAQWLMAYEGGSGTPVAAQEPRDDDEQQAALRRVSAWVQAEIVRREEDAKVRVLAARTGATPARARRALREVRATRTAQGG
jgi:hypothetical protein